MTPVLFEKLKHMVSQLAKTFKLFPETRKSGRPRKMGYLDTLTFALYQHQSTRATKKSVYDDFRQLLSCSYKTFVVSVNAAAGITLRVLAILMRLNRAHAHLVKYTDATDLPVCLKKNADAHRTMRALSGFGHSSKGWYFGLKMTLTRDHDGRMLGVRFTLPRTNDRDICRDINRDIDGIIVLDAGYVSAHLEKDMYREGRRWLLIRPFKTMKKLATAWQLKLYQGRFRIEFDFRNLKLFHGLVTSLPRSVNGYLANYLHALLSFVLA